MEKQILGLDLGPNSIGWSVLRKDEAGLSLVLAGSRIIPMDAATLSDFERGNSQSQTSARTMARSVRRLSERYLLRRERLHRVLRLLDFLPAHYARSIDRYGKFLPGSEPKLAWAQDGTGKFNFLFMDAFHEMLHEFSMWQPDLGEKKIPYDWTLYYLRKKALQAKISREELAWILLNFNRKRGYNQLRDDETEEKENKRVELFSLRVVKVEAEDGKPVKGKIWYKVHLENGWVYRRQSAIPLDWVGKVKDFIVTTELNPDGTAKKDKEGEVKRSFRAPSEGDWMLVKKKTERSIGHQTVGAYIYDALLQNPSQKIRGGLIATIDRSLYKDELRRILAKQAEFHADLCDRTMYHACVEELYPMNEAHRNNVADRDLCYFLIEDVLFYQRPLKSKKSLIDNCPYEYHAGLDPETKEERNYAVKCIAKSHPLFQEFRLWQFLSNLCIYKKGIVRNEDITSTLLKEESDKVALFEWLNHRKRITQKDLLAYPPFKISKKELGNYCWNYVEDREYPCNETRASMLSFCAKANIPIDFLCRETEERLWQILYSVSSEQELVKALGSFANKYGLGETFVEVFRKFPPFKKEYGAYSAKAIKKLLPLMRMGGYWKDEDIDADTRGRIEKIITGEYDERIKNRVREKMMHLRELADFKGLPLWLACYTVYGRHSEAKAIDKWKSPEDIDAYLAHFKQHSLHNPIVEQVVLETLRTVRDIWKQVGRIDEIHIELGRDLKRTKDERTKSMQQALENENTNMRIKYLLTEFMNPEFEIEDVRPYSPTQQEILKIYEDGVWNSGIEQPDEIKEIRKKFNESSPEKRPTRSEVLRYKLWLEQKYRSPYTGRVIPLGKLFTPAYEIEHVIPQSLYFDDSFGNKVICEAEVNKLKSNLLGHRFIEEHHGEKVPLSLGGFCQLFTVAEYEEFVKKTYAGNKRKLKNLMLDDLPDDFISRQLNDSRYISKLVQGLMSNIVREEGEEEAISKHVISCTGGITDRLKRDWGIHDVWNKLILPRFQRMNQLTDSSRFTTFNTQNQEVPAVPLELQKGFRKKRIDHRHHAMDAIMIACANRNIVNYLNNESACSGAETSRQDLRGRLCEKRKCDSEGNYQWILKKPWPTFTQDVFEVLSNIIVSFKQNLRVINKTTNHYVHYDETGKKKLIRQTKGDSWAIRKSMHKDTVFGEVNLRKTKTVMLSKALESPQRIVSKELRGILMELRDKGYTEKQIKSYFTDHKEKWYDVNLSKIEVYYFTKETKDRYFATRKAVDISFNREKIENQVTDTGVRQILLRHLERNGNDPKLAFSPDGIEEMNRNLTDLNGGKQHQPILKVRVYEKADKFAVGKTGNKSLKFVEADKGTNLFFAIYETRTVNKETQEISRKRSYRTIPLNEVIDRQKNGLPPASEDGNGNKPLFVLSPNDLVYLPTESDLRNGAISQPIDKNRIYKMVSATGIRCFFIQACVSGIIMDKVEYLSLNKMERAITGEMIRDICVPLRVDRLGNIVSLRTEL